ncbi:MULTISPECIES: TetR/AcrR family transcriptional regulator [unclassified Microbacterium]|jgi:AcrR family transcriptional regulator|uniref:TetR/AcrR family transcriptional regulator n=1 Tax=unclassified Microbacterium TaxID=2609290 RepID=UPI000CFBF5A3|nr:MULTISPECIES: TetR/AcrR family transcriptional regulator [unclassified Microbacterium]PQZ57457.1 TetR family transcriptional regulator [Microbacterium sp. MYb43]PQZ77333.1 TetR family transcriptional regulator [Microbacterium sp. MYb40]PRB22746.1 TetR family transcriptional regulator [Microbacterium sp. MYb54]PRB28912.1 TetR family transcriptional regulator [Microbacterium sp. MYb50]PRB69012.1 TetR family transcriptional regulator [Microbacterium sp. MYb24]
MSDVVTRAEKAGTDKFAARRRELADAALTAIAERGFARTGLRDVAAHTELSHGLLHYYFEDKDDLIGQAIWQYKSECARRYDPIVESSQTGSELAERFGAEMAATLRDEADMHRLWYDLRNQALFDAGFRDTIIAIDALLSDMVWAVVERFSALEGRTPVVDPSSAYALFDGIFLNALIAYLRGDLEAVEHLRAASIRLLLSAV